MPGEQSLELAQGHLCLLRVEPHAHPAVHLDRGAQLLPGLWPPVHAPIEPTQAGMAVGSHRAHAEIIGQRERSMIVLLGLVRVRGGTAGIDVTEKLESSRLSAPEAAVRGPLRDARRSPGGLVHAIGEKAHAGQSSSRRRCVEDPDFGSQGFTFLDHPQGVAIPPGQRLRQTQHRGRCRVNDAEIKGLAEFGSLLERRYRLGVGTATEEDVTQVQVSGSHAVGLPRGLGNRKRLLRVHHGVLELATLGERPGEPGAR